LIKPLTVIHSADAEQVINACNHCKEDHGPCLL